MARIPTAARENIPPHFRDAFDAAELTMLMGFYAMLAFNLNAFDVDLPDQRTEPILPV